MKKKWKMPSQEALRALYPSDEEREAEAVRAILAHLKDNEKEQPIMKKKISFALVCACILLAVACVAMAVSTNVFGLFAAQYQEGDGMNRLLSTLDEVSAKDGATRTIAPAQDGKHAAADFTIEQTFYDGETLAFSYSLSAGKMPQEAWLPKEGDFEKFGLRKVAIEGVSDLAEKEEIGVLWECEDLSLIEKLKDIRERGEKAGIVLYTTFLGDGVYYGEGEEDYISLMIADERTQEDGVTVGFKRFESPLPDVVRGKEKITLSINLFRGAQYLYFDGQAFMMGGEGTSERISVEIPRTTENQAKAYPFAREYEDYSVEGTLTVTPLECKLNATLLSKTGKTLYDEERAADGIYFDNYRAYADDERIRQFSGESALDGLSYTINVSFYSPAVSANEIRLVPVFIDYAKELAGENGLAERPEEAIVIDLK